MRSLLIRFLPEIFGIAMTLLCHHALLRWTTEKRVRALLQITRVLCVAALLCDLPIFWQYVPASPLLMWLRGLSILCAIGICTTTVSLAVARALERMAAPADLGRRSVLKTAQTAVVAAPALTLAYGAFYERRQLTPKEISITVPGLPADLHGLRIALLSDIHLSSFVPPEHLRAAVDMANAFAPHLTAVTGDLITRDGDPLDECLRELRRLRAEAGVFGCMGNHEVYAGCEAYTEREAARFGMPFLRQRAVTLPFGNSRVRLAGVDYQKMHGVYLAGAQSLLEEGAFPILLSHNPDVFETAAEQGWGLTLAGHTHGGQVTVEYLHQHLNLARFFTPYVYGHYQKEKSHIYVTRGIGTVGVPARVGAVPEVALIKLCAT
jgi:predicted MPP superfamily phosphohydrolase